MPDRPDDRDAMLAQQFVTLADTLVDDFDVVDLMTQLVHAVVRLLPVEHAGLLLLDANAEPQLLAATSESTRLLELFQLQSSEGGPCVECVRHGIPLSVSGLEVADPRWPAFSREARRLGFDSVHAVPLRLRRQSIGALNLFGRGGRLSDDELAVGQSLADMATIALLRQRAEDDVRLQAEQLQLALTSRVVIEQAKGILAEAGDLDMEESFEALRRFARSHNVKLVDVAEHLVSRDLPPALVMTGPTEPV